MGKKKEKYNIKSLELVTADEIQTSDVLQEFREKAKENASAFSQIYRVIVDFGGIRRDVLPFLRMPDLLQEKNDVVFITEFIRSLAEPEWYDLFLTVKEEKLNLAPAFQREIYLCYKDGISYENAEKMYRNAEYPIDIAQDRMEYTQYFLQNQIDERLEERLAGVQMMISELKKEKEHEAGALEKIAVLLERILPHCQSEADQKKAETDKVPDETMQVEEADETEFENDIEEEAEEIENETDAAQEEPIDLAVESLVIEFPEEVQDVQEEADSMHPAKRFLSLFQKIRIQRRKASFGRLPEQRKMEALFAVMKEQNFNAGMYQQVRAALECGVSYEFLYAFVQMEDLKETDLENLVAFRLPEKMKEEQNYVVE